MNATTRPDPHNTFRPNDAFEFTDAYRWGIDKTPAEIRARLQSLNERMGRVGCKPYLLAAYRGYEAILCWIEQRILPGVVKLDDTDPTRCEELTPAGYDGREAVTT